MATKQLQAFVAHFPGQGVRLDLLGRTQRDVWDLLTEPAWEDEPQVTRSFMRKSGWTVLPCTITVDLPAPDQ